MAHPGAAVAGAVAGPIAARVVGGVREGPPIGLRSGECLVDVTRFAEPRMDLEG